MGYLKSVSIYLSLILRHKPEEAGITLDKHGWAKVDELIEGIRKLYVHLSEDVDTAMGVGARHGEPVVWCVDAKAMHRQGFIFYKSVNGVWLTERVPNDFLLYSYTDHREE